MAIQRGSSSSLTTTPMSSVTPVAAYGAITFYLFIFYSASSLTELCRCSGIEPRSHRPDDANPPNTIWRMWAALTIIVQALRSSLITSAFLPIVLTFAQSPVLTGQLACGCNGCNTQPYYFPLSTPPLLFSTSGVYPVGIEVFLTKWQNSGLHPRASSLVGEVTR